MKEESKNGKRPNHWSTRERERERAAFSKISFDFCAKNKANIDIEKRIGLGKNMLQNAKYFFQKDLSFLRAHGEIDMKDKYAWGNSSWKQVIQNFNKYT